MKKNGVVSFVVVALMVVLIGGCRTTARGPSDEEMINNTLTEWQGAVTAKNLDAMMAVYSDAYKGSRGEDKAGVRTFMEQAMQMGYLDGAQVNLEGATTTIEEGKATVAPVSMSTAMGTVTLTIHLAKEEGGWKIVNSEMQR
jgi:ketosteroid isomerase-like protein